MRCKMLRLLHVSAALTNLSLISSFSVQTQENHLTHLRSCVSKNSWHGPSLSSTRNNLPQTRHPSTLLWKHSASTGGGHRSTKRRKAPNNRVAKSWVVEAIEKILQNESKDGKGTNANTIEDDDALVEALHRMQKATSKQNALEAEKAMLAIGIEKKYSYAIQERVLKVVSMAGYVKLSLQILNSMIYFDDDEDNGGGHSNSTAPYIPSSMAYTSVFNRLRKWKKVDTMRETLEKLSRACKLNGEMLDVVVLNTYLAALCDPVKINQVLLEEARQLLDAKVAMERYRFPDPDVISFNTVLNAAAEIGYQAVIDDIIHTMKKQGVVPDIVTYNALLKDASTPTDKLAVMDEIRAFPGLSFDKYTIEMSVLAFAQEGLILELLELLKDFSLTNRDKYSLSNAFSTFLLALVKGGEIDIARAVFDVCILPPALKKSDGTIELFNSTGSKGEDDGDVELIQVNGTTRHFNALFQGYRSLDDPYKWTKDSNSSLSPLEHCSVLVDHMKTMNVAPDSYTVTLLMGLQKKSDDITQLWNDLMERTEIETESPVYHSIITAYGKTGDGASACHVFDRMIASSSLHPNLKSWNVLLSALNKASAINPNTVIDCKACSGSNLKFDNEITNEKPFKGRDFSDIVDCLTPPEAAKAVLDLMNEATVNGEISDLVLAPNSQAFCLVASALSHSEVIDPKDTLDLYNNCVENGLSIDGRFLNAIIRCYGEDISEALNVWKTVYRPAIFASSHKSDRSSDTLKDTRLGKNLVAGYHGLLYVAGRSYRPDIALRLTYAMSKEGVDPTEAALNTYNAGARSRKEDKDKVPLHGQFENLLLVECSKYDSNDSRKMSDKRVRIII